MIVTLKAPSPRKGAGMQFECIKMGVECDPFDGLHYDLTIHDITRAEMIATKFDCDIVAVVDKILFDPLGV